MANKNAAPPAVGKGLGGRKAGQANAHPSLTQIDRYRRELHTKAQQGDTLALAAILLINALSDLNNPSVSKS